MKKNDLRMALVLGVLLALAHLLIFLLPFLWPLYGLSCAQLVSEACMVVIGSLMLRKVLHTLDTPLAHP